MNSHLDTIAALATPLGEGGLAVLRVSGPAAFSIVDACFRPAGGRHRKPSAAESHTVHYGHIVQSGRELDDVLIAVFRNPRSFTGEDTVEVSCHGGVLITRLVLETLLGAGARLAEPGEFTQRAFLNGRIDLAQAEAVADLIHARTELALGVARQQLAGRLSSRIRTLRDRLMLTLAHVEAHLDFPDEDISPDTGAALRQRMQDATQLLDELLRTAPEGQLLRRGLRAAIIGRPNAGKSSLLNVLLGHERAIVSPVAGTTRDTIEETANVRGLPVVFVDTAGLRTAADALEVEGIRRSRAAALSAEMILHVLDASEPLHPDDAALLDEFAQRPRLLIINKSDLARQLVLPPALATNDTVVEVSCATGGSVEALKDALKRAVWRGGVGTEAVEVAINARHQDALTRARTALQRAAEAWQAQATLELIAADLRLAVTAIGEVVGETTTEDLLDRIFSTFCLGK